MDTALIQEVSSKSLAGTITFPEVVQRLSGAGIESYKVDLIRNVKVFYSRTGETHAESFDFDGPAAAPEFNASGVASAVRASQEGRIKYQEFLALILEAGTSDYAVYIDGRRVIYFGRKGDFHIEHFPSQKT